MSLGPHDTKNTINENYQISNQLLQESYFKGKSPSNFQFQPNQITTQNSLSYAQSINQYSYPQANATYFNLPQQQFSGNQDLPYQNYQQIDPSKFHYGNLLYTAESSNKLDRSAYIHLIETEKYYWLIDLINDIDFWKSYVPSFCFKSADENSDPFLLDCLINCSKQRDFPLERLTKIQSERWNKIKSSFPLENSHLVELETILISICLILLSIYLKELANHLTGFHKIVLNNQIRLFNQISNRTTDLLKLKSGKTGFVVVGCIQTVAVLKFLITRKHSLDQDKGLSFGSILNNQGRSFESEDSNAEITYPENTGSSFSVDMTPMLNMTKFDKANLNNSFKDFDYVQLKFAKNSKKEYKSDAFKLREYFWYLIKLTYLMYNPDADQEMEIDYNFLSKHENSNTSSLLEASSEAQMNSFTILPYNNFQETPSFNKQLAGSITSSNHFPFLSSRHTACGILTETISKLLNPDKEDVIRNSNNKIKEIFDQIENSLIEPKTERQWRDTFGWALSVDNASASNFSLDGNS
ncbi:Adhesion and hyphal regulator 1 [Spathaspora sp. JA1]|nr:Adhesion and hyphal regulator 1 [Spathaspora sp. JA1]